MKGKCLDHQVGPSSDVSRSPNLRALFRFEDHSRLNNVNVGEHNIVGSRNTRPRSSSTAKAYIPTSIRVLIVWWDMQYERSLQELVTFVALEVSVVLVGQPGCRDHVRPPGLVSGLYQRDANSGPEASASGKPIPRDSHSAATAHLRG